MRAGNPGSNKRPSLNILNENDAVWQRQVRLRYRARDPYVRTAFRAFLGNPFQGARYAHYLEIDVSALDVIEGRPGVFVIPNEEPLDLTDVSLPEELTDGQVSEGMFWRHTLETEPIVLYSEINDKGEETRKVEQYRDGRLDYASASQSTGTTFLREKMMPSLEEIGRQAEFAPMEITPNEFEQVWHKATSGS
jgi:hypothetical protein